MFCPNCGRPADAGVKFCASCGTQIGAQTGSAAGVGSYPPPVSSFPMSKLIRPRYPRMIAGVCSAFALQYGWDLSLVRILTVVFALITSGFGGLCYVAAWIIIPEGAYALPTGMSPAAAYPPPSPPPPSSNDIPAA